MLHLFNSCYVYPDVLFDPSSNYIVVGKNSNVYGIGLDKSSYYNNIQVKGCLGRFSSAEEFVSSNMLLPAVSANEKMVIYADDESLLKLFTMFVRAHITRQTTQLYWDLREIFAIRLTSILEVSSSDQIKESLRNTVKYILKAQVSVDNLPLDSEWVKKNAGIEWKIAKGDLSTIPDFIDRYVFSFYEQARVNYLSRKPAEGSWAVDPQYSNIRTIPSMAEFYSLVRKEVLILLDDVLLEYYKTNDVNVLLKDRRFLMLLSSNKDLFQKIDIWMLRWLLKQDITQLGIVA
jgi:hypothetical protein